MTTKIEKRVFPIKVETRADKDGTEKRVLVGMPIVYESKSENFGSSEHPFYEVIKRGAATNALKTSDVRALYDHGGNGTLPLGRESAGTVQLRETEKGVESVIFPPDTAFVRDLFVSVDRGDLREMSFAFTKKKDSFEYRNGAEYRNIQEFAGVFDVSIVPFAAYPDTSVAVEARNKWKTDLNTEHQKQTDDEQRKMDTDIFFLTE